MQKSVRITFCILTALILSTSLFPVGIAEAQRSRGGGSRGGAGISRGSGASPRVNRSTNLQNRGNFDNSAQNRQSNRQGNWTERQGTRQDNRTDRQGNRQDNWTDRQGTRQDNRTDRQGNRQDNRTDRQRNRQNFLENNAYRGWRGGGWFGRGYYVPPGWGWAAFTGGLLIGAAINSLPPYYSRIYVGSTQFIYSDGVFMQPQGNTYVIVAPPIGAIVEYLPDGCVETEINNLSYFNCSGVYYQPVFQRSSIVYQVVKL